MKILFTSLGFSTSHVFLKKEDGCVMVLGYLDNRLEEPRFEYWEGVEFLENTPSSSDVITEYKRQYEERGVCLTGDITYAG